MSNFNRIFIFEIFVKKLLDHFLFFSVISFEKNYEIMKLVELVFFNVEKYISILSESQSISFYESFFLVKVTSHI